MLNIRFKMRKHFMTQNRILHVLTQITLPYFQNITLCIFGQSIHKRKFENHFGNRTSSTTLLLIHLSDYT